MYDKLQLEQLQLAKDLHVDYHKIDNPDFCWQQMSEIVNGMVHKVNVSLYADPKWTWEQMNEIRLSLEAGFKNICDFITPEFNHRQIREIRYGYLDHVDFIRYADISFDYKEMRTLRIQMKREKDNLG